MKNKLILAAFITCIALLSSCGLNNAIVVNTNQNSTQVHLTSNNYKVVDKISGSAEVKYICLIGGMKKTQLYENAYSAMVAKANLIGGSRALINIVTEEQFSGFFPFSYKRTITVSAHVIEFVR